MASDQAPELLPCPWCKGRDISILPCGQDYGQGLCNGCLARGPLADEIGDWTMPHRAWNRRADASPLPPPGSAAEAEMVERGAKAILRASSERYAADAALLDEHWKWYLDGRANPDSCVHYSNPGRAHRDARAALRAAFAKGGESAGEGRSG